MSALDLRVFLLINGVMACLMAVVLCSQWRTYPKSIQGLDRWALAQLVAFVATLLFGLQGMAPPLVSMAAANVLLVLAGALLLSGTARHFQRHLPRHFLVLLMVVTVPTMVALSGRAEDYIYRLLFICVVVGMLLLAQAWLVWRHGLGGFGSRFTLVVLLLLALVMAVRAVTALRFLPADGIFVPSTMQALYLGSFSFGLLLLSIGGILMASERLRIELEHLASHDSLTGAYTRRAFFGLGENEVARSQRLGTPMSALMMDLDHFKAVNDQHGHHVGDLVLADFVHRTQAILRRPTILARMGGEEFVALLPDTDRQAAWLVATRILKSTTVNPALPRCQVSIGLAAFDHGGGDTLGDLMARADAALYRAKQLGRNRVEEAPAPVA